MQWTIKQEHEGMLIRDYLQQVHGFSRRILKAVKLDGGEIAVNGVPQTVRFVLAADDVLTIQFPPEDKGTFMEPESIPLSIVYEDDAVIVIDKQAGAATIPSRHHATGTIANGLLAYYAKHSIPYTIHIVTRLDRDTSGLLLVAKHRYSHSILAASQKAGKVKRKYRAIVEGHPLQRNGTIDAPIDRKEGSIIERAVVSSGKRAVTHYEVVDESPSHTMVNVQLETGRTHQIRVHFAHLGHPLAGDDLYGGSVTRISRQALHCCELTFMHPITKEIVHFQSAVPDDMRFLSHWQP
ncbi:RluA family pseudouridine synthase [Virgibacillus oceani]|uniref:Pseudouridine synthase n=1 Tax=Virgibacillus oceani TaxID=1479511 RepID=A0A917M4G4_9BACI|nr:RluA family pseudouridine synthase [Virgibacillus oceani]GGG78172.1 pseudouridine synthase [Virgibacillus oceani]